jgi:hypothetical protein
MVLDVDLSDLDHWCHLHLRAGIDDVVFRSGHLSVVVGVRLISGRRVVVKIRRPAERLEACSMVHRRLFELGFPCPEPVIGLEPFGDLVASAESMVEGGTLLPTSGRSPAPFGHALARLVTVAPAPNALPSLEPAMSWTHPGAATSGLWPTPDDLDVDLNQIRGPAWIDEMGQDARSRLLESDSPSVIGHGDWYTGNLRWHGVALYVAWDWDSVIAASEPIVAGLAAAVYPAKSAGTEATVEESEEFLDDYEGARGRPFTVAEREEAWAAGLWNRSFDAKKQVASGGRPLSLTESEARDRSRRAGLG